MENILVLHRIQPQLLITVASFWSKVNIYSNDENVRMKNGVTFSEIVPPRWIQEPQDTALMLGNGVVIPCEADGYPEPEITWLKGGDEKYMFKFFIIISMFFLNSQIN